MTAQRSYHTEQQYLEMERTAATKSQFFQGEIFAMAGGSPAHSLIATNIAGELRTAFKLKGRPCRVYNSDLRVKVEATGLLTYPDVTAICEKERFADERKPDTLLNPLLLIEVVSESTEACDRGKKFFNYRQMLSLEEYVLVSQSEARVESYRRQDDGETWLLSTAEGLNSMIDLLSINIRLSLAEVYDQVVFSPEAPIPEESGAHY